MVLTTDMETKLISHIPTEAQHILIALVVELTEAVALDLALDQTLDQTLQDLEISTAATEEILVEVPEGHLVTTQAVEVHQAAALATVEAPPEKMAAPPSQIYHQATLSMMLSPLSICVSQSSIHISTKAH